ncbi:MAG: hypothetical protein U1A72_22325 [Sulfuritalea sp.]|nr:hypothetical protein [Sulfuritalea sp.]
MTFLMFLAGFGLWLAAAIMLSKRIPRWLGASKHGAVISVLLFPFVLVAPVADELIGRWQFHRLCEREAVVTLSPDWEKVKRAGEREIPSVTLSGYLIRIRSQRMEYFDVDTGKNFFTNQAFHAYGGFLVYRMGLGLGTSTACWPKDSHQTYQQTNLDQLTKQGKKK